MLDNQKTLLSLALREGASVSALDLQELETLSGLPYLDILTFNELMVSYFATSLTSNYTFKLVSDKDDKGCLVFDLVPIIDGVECLEIIATLNTDRLSAYDLGNLINRVSTFTNDYLEFTDLGRVDHLKNHLDDVRALNTLVKGLVGLKTLYDYKDALRAANKLYSPLNILPSEVVNDTNHLDDFKKVKLFTLETFKDWVKRQNLNPALQGYFKAVKGLDKGAGYYLYYFTNREYKNTIDGYDLGALDLTAAGLFSLIQKVSDLEKIDLKNTTTYNYYYAKQLINDLETFKGVLNSYLFNSYTDYLDNLNKSTKGVK